MLYRSQCFGAASTIQAVGISRAVLAALINTGSSGVITTDEAKGQQGRIVLAFYALGVAIRKVDCSS